MGLGARVALGAWSLVSWGRDVRVSTVAVVYLCMENYLCIGDVNGFFLSGTHLCSGCWCVLLFPVGVISCGWWHSVLLLPVLSSHVWVVAFRFVVAMYCPLSTHTNSHPPERAGIH